MYYSSPSFVSNNYFRVAPMDKSYIALEEALGLVSDAILGEREDELFYDYLISVAPTSEEKSIIESIRDDEKKHHRYFSEIYAFYTGKSIAVPGYVPFEKPQSYVDGIKKAKSGELGAAERYRNIRAGLYNEYHKDMVFEILTDELRHAHKYNHLLCLNLEGKLSDINTDRGSYELEEDTKVYHLTRSCFGKETREFTASELAQYDGTDGRPAYVAINGIVYDISGVSLPKVGILKT